MQVSVWPNGRKLAANGYFGITISRPDRARFFNETSPTISIDVGGHLMIRTLPPSYWSKCPHICHKEICDFIKKHRLDFWPRGKPSFLILQPVSVGHFRLHLKVKEDG